MVGSPWVFFFFHTFSFFFFPQSLTVKEKNDRQLFPLCLPRLRDDAGYVACLHRGSRLSRGKVQPIFKPPTKKKKLTSSCVAAQAEYFVGNRCGRKCGSRWAACTSRLLDSLPWVAVLGFGSLTSADGFSGYPHQDALCATGNGHEKLLPGNILYSDNNNKQTGVTCQRESVESSNTSGGYQCCLSDTNLSVWSDMSEFCLVFVQLVFQWQCGFMWWILFFITCLHPGLSFFLFFCLLFFFWLCHTPVLSRPCHLSDPSLLLCRRTDQPGSGADLYPQSCLNLLSEGVTLPVRQPGAAKVWQPVYIPMNAHFRGS